MSGVVGIEIGAEVARLVHGRVRRGAFEIQHGAEIDRDDLAATVKALGLKGARTIVGVTGRDMILRVTQVPPVPAWQLRDLMGFEIDEIAEQSGDALSADFNVLGGAALYSDEDMVLLALVREALVEQRTAELGAAGLTVSGFTPHAVALHNAFVATDGRDGTVMVVSIGETTTDIAFVQDGELLFARNLTGGRDLMVSAVASAFKLDAAKAEAALARKGRFARPGEALEGQSAAVSRALDGALRQLTGMLQSSLTLCRTQLQARELAVDAVLLAGPGAAVPGLDQALTRSMGVPAERFDPAEGYVVGDAEELEQRGGDFAVATGLAMMGALPDAYRIEVLSEAARARRAFRTRTVWLVAAALLVVAHLGVMLWVRQGNTAAAEADRARLRAEVESRQSATRDHERMRREIDELGARLALLEQATSPGAGLLAALDALEATLPPELWLTEMRTTHAVEPAFGHGTERRPYVVVTGRGKEVSRNLTDAVTELTVKLRADPRIAAVIPQMETDPRGDFTWTLTLDASLFPPEGDEADDGAAEGEEFAAADGGAP